MMNTTRNMGNQEIPLNQKALVTVKELQTLTGIGRNNCFRLVRESRCSLRVGKKILVDRAAFLEWCRKQYT